MAVKQQRGGADARPNQLFARRERIRVGPAKAHREPLLEGLGRKRERVMVEGDDDERVPGGDRERRARRGDLLPLERPIAAKIALILRPRGVEQHEVKPLVGGHLHALTVEEISGGASSDAVVVSRNHAQSARLPQGRKELIEQRALFIPAAVGDVAGDQHVLDAVREEPLNRAAGDLGRVRGFSEMEVGQVRQSLLFHREQEIGIRCCSRMAARQGFCERGVTNAFREGPFGWQGTLALWQ